MRVGLSTKIFVTVRGDRLMCQLRHQMEARESDEAKEGITAFLEKRPPKWAG